MKKVSKAPRTAKPAKRRARTKPISIAAAVRTLEGITDEFEDAIARMRRLAYHLDRHRARAAKRRARRA